MGSAGSCAPRNVGAEVPQTAPANLVVAWCRSRKPSADQTSGSGVAHYSCRRPQVVAGDNLGALTGQLGCRESAKGVDAGQIRWKQPASSPPVIRPPIPGPNRLPETIATFIAVVFVCLVLGRMPRLRVDRQSSVPSECHEARRLGELRIGVPEGLVHLDVTRKQGRLEQRLTPLGVNVQWRECFSASAPLQALDRAEIDFYGGGGTPSVFAQATDPWNKRI